MKTNNPENTPGRNLADRCVACYQKIASQINEAKNRIVAEFQDLLDANEHLLHLALNEAEALAWQTPYPQLVFPDLAVEKIQAVANWSSHQYSVRRANPAPALGA
jgi:hypothetical protein